MLQANACEVDVLTTLRRVFRFYGYDGASLSRIIAATGLAKASLYHRFAGGKADMARAVLDSIADRFREHVLMPLSQPGDPEQRVQETGDRLRKFFGSGNFSCLLDTITVNRSNRRLKAHACRLLEDWIATFAELAEECGVPPKLAAQRSEDAVAAIEGALVVARVSGNRQVFQRAIDSLPGRLLHA